MVDIELSKMKELATQGKRLNEQIDKLTKDRDTWKKACELVVDKWRKWEELSTGEIEASNEEIAKVIYQQAKEKKNDIQN